MGCRAAAATEPRKQQPRRRVRPRPSKTTRSIAWVRTLTVAAPTQLQPRRRVRISSTAPSISGAAPLHLISHLKLSRVRIFSRSCGTLYLFPASRRLGATRLWAAKPNAGWLRAPDARRPNAGRQVHRIRSSAGRAGSPPPKFQALGVPEASLGGCSAADPQQAAAERGFSQRRPPVGRLCRTAAPQQKAARGPVAGGMRSAPRLCVLRGALGVRCSPQGARGVLCGARGEWRAATL